MKLTRDDGLRQGILKGEVSLYHWPPVWLFWISLFFLIKTEIISSQTADSEPVKQEVNGTVILPLKYSLVCTLQVFKLAQ